MGKLPDQTKSRKRRHAAPTVLYVSQRTCLAVLGLEPREFLEAVRSLGVPSVKRGKLVLCRPEDLIAALERDAAVDEGEADGVNAVLAVVGYSKGNR